MPEFKVVVSDPKTGKAKTVEVKDREAEVFLGLKIGDEIDGSILGFSGVKLQITGGSGKAGEPMRPDIHGGVKKRVLLSGPPGYHPPKKGLRKRKFVRGNVITEDIVQINVKIVYKSPDQKPLIT
ncbi:MAG: 30S ribosomal protein S6e [Thermoprotei archaeon]|nr:MAG: 30S ribosomal protein S6e [Thermoprotei archaeon]RLE98873.1 MAG: 30S ribosomal protein S6e [Thermoprotei archaeon]